MCKFVTNNPLERVTIILSSVGNLAYDFVNRNMSYNVRTNDKTKSSILSLEYELANLNRIPFGEGICTFEAQKPFIGTQLNKRKLQCNLEWTEFDWIKKTKLPKTKQNISTK